ncbi:MAG: ABC transporter [Chloroflexi bacterium]|nr:MAG: ABC transporter [Chloroflexota bacterium]
MSETVVSAPAVRRRGAASAAWSNARAVYIIWYRDVLRYSRERAQVVASLAQPLLYLIIFGTGLSSAIGGARFGPSGANYQTFIYPGIIGMTILFTSIFGAMSVVWDREFGFLKEVLVAPIDRSAVAIGKTLGGATRAMIQGLLLLVLAPLIGVALSVGSILGIVVLAFILAFALSALGVALAARMRSMQGFQVVMNFLMLPMFFLSGALFPLSGLPDWMTILTRLDPATYGMDALRRAVLGSAADPLGVSLFGQIVPIWLEALILIAFGLVMLGLAVRSFQVRD